MSYEEDIKRRVRTTELWPDFESPAFLGTLDELAEESLEKNTVEGALASVLIYLSFPRRCFVSFSKARSSSSS